MFLIALLPRFRCALRRILVRILFNLEQFKYHESWIALIDRRCHVASLILNLMLFALKVHQLSSASNVLVIRVLSNLMLPSFSRIAGGGHQHCPTRDPEAAVPQDQDGGHQCPAGREHSPHTQQREHELPLPTRHARGLSVWWERYKSAAGFWCPGNTASAGGVLGDVDIRFFDVKINFFDVDRWFLTSIYTCFVEILESHTWFSYLEAPLPRDGNLYSVVVGTSRLRQVVSQSRGCCGDVRGIMRGTQFVAERL